MEIFLLAFRNKYIFLECYLKSLEIMIPNFSQKTLEFFTALTFT